MHVNLESSAVKKTFFLLSLMVNIKLFTTNSSLVNIKRVDPSLIVDLKYATKGNFTGHMIYSSLLCLAHRAKHNIFSSETFSLTLLVL